MNRPPPGIGKFGVGVIGALLVAGAGVLAWKDRPREEFPLVANQATLSPVTLNKFSTATLTVAGLEMADEENADDKNARWGDVKGQIVLDAPAAPAPVELSVTKDQNVCLAKGPLLGEELVVNKSNLGIKNVFVWLVPDDPQKPLAIHPKLQQIKQKKVEVDQPCCVFVPHALCLRQGQDLIAKNPSAISHSFHWTGNPLKNAGGNQIVAAGSDLRIDSLVADRYPVKMSCDIHPWMAGWIRVFDHPYFALTDADGKFEIKDAPTGPCHIMTWQESKGWVFTDRDSDGRVVGKAILIPEGKALDLGVVKMAPPKLAE
jgi:hypothetical protein